MSGAPFPRYAMPDESIPEAVRKKLADLAGDDAVQWLSEELAFFRALRDTPEPSAAQERKALDGYVRALRAAEAILSSPEQLPPIVRQLIHEAEYPHNLPDARELYRQIVVKRRLAERVQKQIEGWTTPAGRKAATGRDALLAGLIRRLQDAGLTLWGARIGAAEILRGCRVPVPARERDIRRAAGGGGE